MANVKALSLTLLLASCTQPAGPASLQTVPATYYTNYRLYAIPSGKKKEKTYVIEREYTTKKPEYSPRNAEDMQKILDEIQQDIQSSIRQTNDRKYKK